MIEDGIAVVIPCYQQEHYLFRALSSVIWQLRESDEVIVIHDAPGPLSAEFLAPFGNRVIVLQTKGRQGVSFCRNRGIERTSRKWIKFLDADDLLAPYALNIVRGGIEIPDTTKIVTGGCDRYLDGAFFDYRCANDETMANFHRQNPTMPSLVFARRDALLEVGLFNEEIDHEEDWDLWFRMRERFGIEAFQIVEQPVCSYWVSRAERQTKRRTASINGQYVREYLRERYGADPAD